MDSRRVNVAEPESSGSLQWPWRCGESNQRGQEHASLGQDELPPLKANEARLKMGVIAYNILQIIREFFVWGEPVKRSMEWLILRLIKVGAGVTYHARRWHVHVASAFPLRNHYRAVLAWA